jgi:hypothetical protein
LIFLGFLTLVCLPQFIIFDSLSVGTYDERYLLEYYAVKADKNLPTLSRYILPPSSDWKGNPRKE